MKLSFLFLSIFILSIKPEIADVRINYKEAVVSKSKVFLLSNDLKGITKNKPYKTIDEMIESLKKKDVWYKEMWFEITYRFKDFLRIPKDIYIFFKNGLQRWVKGWSDEDCWECDSYFISIIVPMLQKLKRDKFGTFTGTSVKDVEEDKEFKKIQKIWDDILDNIIWTFKTANKMQTDHWYYVSNENERVSLEKTVNGLNRPKRGKNGKIITKYHLMTKEECKKYRKGWFYFQKHFKDLWD